MIKEEREVRQTWKYLEDYKNEIEQLEKKNAELKEIIRKFQDDTSECDTEGQELKSTFVQPYSKNAMKLRYAELKHKNIDMEDWELVELQALEKVFKKEVSK